MPTSKPDNTRRQPRSLAAHAEQSRRAARLRDTAGRFAKRGEQQAPAPTQETPPPGTIPCPLDAPADTYALQIIETGLGLHAPPGASVLVVPELPTGAGLAVFYFKKRPLPSIFDLTHNFDPRFVQPFAPGSEMVPLIEVVDPVTGRFGRLRADGIERIHRIIGIYTPAEIAEQHLRAPDKLPVMTTCPDGMGEHRVESGAAYPLVRPGETVVYDPSCREPTDGALCALQWNGARRDVLLTNWRRTGAQGERRWWVDPVNRPSNSTMLKRRLGQGTGGGLLYASDGPYTEEHLRERIVGTVVGVLVPHWAQREA